MIQYDVIVIGAGMVGMTAALGIAQLGCKVALIESQPQKAYVLPSMHMPYDQRIVAVTHASEKLFETLGVWQAMQASRIAPFNKMFVWDSEREGNIEFSASDYFESNLGYMIEQNVILSALWQSIKCHPEITGYFDMRIASLSCEHSQSEVTLQNGEKLSAQLIIGSDGRHSYVREQMKIASSSYDYQQTAIVATLKTEKPHYSTAYQRFARSGTVAWLPLADPHLVSIVWSTSHEETKTLCNMSEKDFCEALRRESDNYLGAFTLESQRIAFPLTTHHAKHYVVPRCVLVGDAAHTIHPLAGLGVNLGLLDLSVLFEILKASRASKRDLGALSQLKKYERRRRWHNGFIRQSMTLFRLGFGSSLPIIEFLRNKGLNFVNQQPSIKRLILSQGVL